MKLKLLAIVAMLALMVGYVINHVSAQTGTGQGFPASSVPLNLSGTSIAPNTTGTMVSQAFSANGVTGFAVMPSYNLTGTGVASITFDFSPALSPSAAVANGTTGATGFTTTVPATAPSTASGTNVVFDYIDLPPHVSGSGVANAPYWYLSGIKNGNAGTTSTCNIISVTITTSNR